MNETLEVDAVKLYFATFKDEQKIVTIPGTLETVLDLNIPILLINSYTANCKSSPATDAIEMAKKAEECLINGNKFPVLFGEMAAKRRFSYCFGEILNQIGTRLQFSNNRAPLYSLLKTLACEIDILRFGLIPAKFLTPEVDRLWLIHLIKGIEQKEDSPTQILH